MTPYTPEHQDLFAGEVVILVKQRQYQTPHTGWGANLQTLRLKKLQNLSSPKAFLETPLYHKTT